MSTPKDRTRAITELELSEVKLDATLWWSKLFSTLFFCTGLAVAIATVALLNLRPEQPPVVWYVGGIGSFALLIVGCLFAYQNNDREALLHMIAAQRIDLATKQDAIMNVIALIDDSIRSEFRKLGFPQRHHCEASLEIATALERDLGKLSLRLHDSGADIASYMRTIRESEGVTRLTGLSGYLTTTGLQHDAVNELFELLSERLAHVEGLLTDKQPSTEHAVRLIIAAQAFDEALALIVDFYDDRKPVSLADVRAARVAAE